MGRNERERDKKSERTVATLAREGELIFMHSDAINSRASGDWHLAAISSYRAITGGASERAISTAQQDERGPAAAHSNESLCIRFIAASRESERERAPV